MSKLPQTKNISRFSSIFQSQGLSQVRAEDMQSNCFSLPDPVLNFRNELHEVVEKITESNKNTTNTLIQTFKDQQQKGFAEIISDITNTKQKIGYTYKELSERKQKNTEKMREIKRLVGETTAKHLNDSRALTESMELVRKRLETLTAKPKKRVPALACGKPKKVLK